MTPARPAVAMSRVVSSVMRRRVLRIVVMSRVRRVFGFMPKMLLHRFRVALTDAGGRT